MKNKKIEIAIIIILILIASFLTLLANKEIEIITFILFYNSISNCFKTRFHADTLYPNSAIKASFICKLITISVCIYFVISCISVEKSFYMFITQILIIAFVSCLLQIYFDFNKYVRDLNKIKKKIDFKNLTEQEIYDVCKEHKININIANRIVDHYIKGMPYQDIADQNTTTLEAIRNCFNRAKNKINENRK